MDESGEFAVVTVTSAVGDVKEETTSTGSVDVPSATEEKAAAKEDAKK